MSEFIINFVGLDKVTSRFLSQKLWVKRFSRRLLINGKGLG